jgi:hypothetical protein
MGPLDKLDYCTIVLTEKEYPCFTNNINSLIRFSGPDYFDLHVSIREGDSKTRDFCRQFPVFIHEVPLYTKEQMYRGHMHRASEDTANRNNLLVAGSNKKWVIIAHSDITFTGSIISEIEHTCIEGVGMVGAYAHGLAVINKKAFETCHCGFWLLPGGVSVIRPAYNDALIVSKSDIRNVNGINSQTFDVGDFLRFEMQNRGWLFKEGNFTSFYTHKGGGSNHASFWEKVEK